MMEKDRMLTETKISGENVFDGRLLHVYRDTVSLPDGNTSTREYIMHVGAVCVIPINEKGEAILERQYRYPTGEVLLEIPAGKLNGKTEDPELAVRRELREETGVSAGKLEYMGYFYPTPAYSDEKIHMYLATELSYGKTQRDEDEFIDVVKMPLSELVELVLSGQVPDIKTQAAALRAQAMLNKH